MNRLHELQEAKVASEIVILKIDNAKKTLNSALSWGIFDMFGGGMISSLVKREKIGRANKEITEIREALNSINSELADINIKLTVGISDTLCDKFLDIWFDNIFIDLRVQSEMKNTLHILTELKKTIVELLEIIEQEIEKNYRRE